MPEVASCCCAVLVLPGPRRDVCLSWQVEMDANEYMDQLKAEAQALRSELAGIERKKVEQQSALTTSICTYVSSLPPDQIKVRRTGLR